MHINMATCPHCGKELKITLTIDGSQAAPIPSNPRPVTARPVNSPTLQSDAAKLFSLMAQNKKEEIAKLTKNSTSQRFVAKQ